MSIELIYMVLCLWKLQNGFSNYFTTVLMEQNEGILVLHFETTEIIYLTFSSIIKATSKGSF